MRFLGTNSYQQSAATTGPLRQFALSAPGVSEVCMRLKNLAIAISLVIVCALDVLAGSPPTMRLDYFHTGNAAQELFSVDRVVIEPLPWPGNPSKLIDTTNRGVYYFEVRDASSQRVLYSRGFSSIYGEWVTSTPAHKVYYQQGRAGRGQIWV